MTQTQYSIAAASRATSKSRNTISKDLREGKLSYVKRPDGSKLIDASELIRVYGDAFKPDRDGDMEKASLPDSRQKRHVVANDDAELKHLREKLESINQERERERSQLQDRIVHLEANLKALQETHHRTTLLVDNRSGGGDWEKLAEVLGRFAVPKSSTSDATVDAKPPPAGDMPQKASDGKKPGAAPAKSWKDKTIFQIMLGR